jgi:hypothetical protein
MIRRYTAVLMAIGLVAGCDGTAPNSLSFSMGAQRAWPVVPLSAQVNGRDMTNALNAVSSGWDDGTGGGSAMLVDFPTSSDADQVDVNVAWIEAISGRAWQANLSTTTDALDIYGGSRPIARLVVLIGRNGQLRLTDGSPTVIAETCGDRVASNDRDYRRDIGSDQLIAVIFANADGLATPATPCPDPVN